jgi:aryl-alcohol dehydrogenase-like predicted oxidoreductase
MNRIVLGGAQLGLPYGILNNGESLGDAQVAEILDTAFEFGINQIDTAIAYGNSEALIGTHGQGRFAIISKLPPIPDVCTDVQGWVGEQITSSLSRLRVTRLDALLLHQPSDLTGKHGDNLFSAISQLKKNQLIKRFGLSIYSPHDLDGILEDFELDVVQTPFNVFDQRINAHIERLSSLGIEIHARSIFLQGVLLTSHSTRPTFFDRWNNELSRFDAWVKETGQSAMQCCLSFALQNQGISKIVIGSTSAQSLSEVMRCVQTTSNFASPNFDITDETLIDPRKWATA